MICVNCGCCGEVDILRAAVESVLEHHFNNHSLCGTWCKVNGLRGTEREEAMLK
jgi:hypothetical protein